MTTIDYLLRSAELYPDKTAFADEHQSLTYRETLDRARRIASGLTKVLTCTNEPIAVIIDRNVESLCAFFGITLTRNFYVPIDVSQPIQRIETILGQMKPAAMIAIDNMPEGLEPDPSILLLEYRDLVAAEPDDAKLAAIRKTCLDTDPLYAICTSGSTGVPKGVLISHRSVLDFIPVFCRTFHFRPDEVFGNQAPFDFDVSVKDIYSSLYLGATVYIIPRTCFAMPAMLMDTLDDQKITTVVWAVSAMCIAAQVRAFDYKVPGSIRNVLFSGEVMPMRMLNIWRKAFPEAMFVNLYGPTEITCNCLYYIIDREFGNTDKLPLGVPFENEQVMYLNEENKPIGVGEIGEICVTGTCLALGYYRNPEKTAASFVQNPCNDRYPEMMYRTGDLAELKESGEYYFAARKDFQIKHMGHRIELEEIELHLNAIPAVLRACCLFDTDRNKIVCCYVGDCTKVEIINDLKEHLPKYMLPNVYIRMEEIPLNKNGKVDRQRLKAIYQESRSKKPKT